VGLIAVGSYSGDIQHARFETFDYECNLDTLKLTAHPSRKGADEGAWCGDICAAGTNASRAKATDHRIERTAPAIMGLLLGHRSEVEGGFPAASPTYSFSSPIIPLPKASPTRK
jgi:hypothetical protein